MKNKQTEKKTSILPLTDMLLKEKNPEIYNRGEEGFNIYASSMDASQQEKARIIPFIRPGLVAEMGCGNGAVLELISNTFPQSQVFGFDISDTLLQMSADRKYKNSNVTIIKKDVREKIFEDDTLDTIVYCSTLHEIYSYSGYNKHTLKQTLKNAYDMLAPGGRLVIRDGPKPEDELLYLRFKNQKTEEKFKKFSEEFGPYNIYYEETGEGFKLRSSDAMEFLSKYIYEKNWVIEVKEQFAIYTPAQYAKELENIGFKVIHNESYLIEWLKKTHYEKDIEVYRKNKDTGAVEIAPYPDSTMIIVAEKPIKAMSKLKNAYEVQP